MVYTCFLDEWNRIMKFKSFSKFHKILFLGLRRNPDNWLILKFVFIHCIIVRVIENDQIQFETWFTSVFLINGTELRSFSHFRILTKIAYPDLSRNLENWLILKFVLINCKTVKVSQNDQTRLQTWFPSVSFKNGTELRSFSHFQIFTKSYSWALAEILIID